MHFLTDTLWFPHPNDSDPQGFLAWGGDLSVQRLLLAYHSGIFPWYEQGGPILWWSPDPRIVLFPEKFKVSKSLQKTINSEKFTITFNSDFPRVIQACAHITRKGEAGTWITREMQSAYNKLHSLGHAFSVEAWRDDNLVGGLYGIDLPDRKIFCGESMFSLVTDASKVAFYYLVEHLKTKNYRLIDCQIYNPHLESLGAEEIERELFLEMLVRP